MNVQEAMQLGLLTQYTIGVLEKEELAAEDIEDLDSLVVKFGATVEKVQKDWEKKIMRHITLILGRAPVLKKAKDTETGQEFTYMI